jgi:O-antigen ligase
MLALSIVAGLGVAAANLEVLQVSRQLEILDLSESSSWVVREYFQQQALGQISDSPILGVYGGHWIFGEGNYSHNALSAWVSLGLPGFLIYMALCIVSAMASVRALMRRPTSRYAQLATLVSIPTLFLVVLAKPVFWELPPLAWATAVIALVEYYLKTPVAPPVPNRKLSFRYS